MIFGLSDALASACDGLSHTGKAFFAHKTQSLALHRWRRNHCFADNLIEGVIRQKENSHVGSKPSATQHLCVERSAQSCASRPAAEQLARFFMSGSPPALSFETEIKVVELRCVNRPQAEQHIDFSTVVSCPRVHLGSAPRVFRYRGACIADRVGFGQSANRATQNACAGSAFSSSCASSAILG